ncbi:MAG: mechanosensitive ion channel [Deltaproteobacteria bacterium]|nr:mechanosensitive ion channel [Deltaproteobacteria bacterium]
MKRISSAAILVLFATLCFGQLAYAKETAKTSKPATEAVMEQTTIASTPGLADLVLKAAELSKRLTDLEESLGEVFDPSTAESSFSGTEERLSDLSSRLEELKTAKTMVHFQLVQLKAALQQERDFLEKNLKPLTASLRKVSALKREWSKEKKQWTQWQASPDEDMQIRAMQSTFARAQETVSKAHTTISQHLEPLLAAEIRRGDLQARTYSIVSEVNDLISDRRGVVSTELSPPMLSSRYVAQFSLGLWHELRQGIRTITFPDRQFFARQGWVILLQILLALALAAVLQRSRQSLEESEKLRALTERPFALGVIVSLGTLTGLYTLYTPTWQLLMRVFGWIALARVVGVYTTRSSLRWLIYGMAFIMITIQLFRVLSLPLPLFRLYVFVVALVGLILWLWLARQSRRSKDSPLYTYGLRLGSLILMIVALVEVSGKADLALDLLESSLLTFSLVLVAWLFMLLARSGLDWAVYRSRLQKISVFRNHASSIADKSILFINLIIGFFLIVAILAYRKVYDSPVEAFNGLLSLGVTLGSQRITLGLLLASAFLLYGSFVVSSAVQVLLLEEVFPKRNVGYGVGLSISRLIQYFLIFVGFLLALATLGFTLTNLTILGGAIGIGIGFGLQAIVNNFASGLILLFERPIRIGDMIQLGDLPCTVKKMGLRSTVVQSLDDADIVIPNSDLITNQVTNWTLSGRSMRLKIQVGVAYGSDVTLVMGILEEIAERNLSVLSNPAPNTIFLGFGNSSLDFELRVRIKDFLYRRRIQTELNQEIERRFRLEGIKIPFPQRDLHVRSVDESTGSILTPPGDQRPDLAGVSSKKKDKEEDKNIE